MMYFSRNRSHSDSRWTGAAIWTRPAVVLLLLIAATTSGGCSDTSRPDLADWMVQWESVTASLPTLDELGTPPDRDLCGHALGAVRTAQSELLPTPDLALDPVVDEWFTVAEDALFECPPSSNQLPDIDYAYQVLSSLEEEVDAAVAVIADG